MLRNVICSCYRRQISKWKRFQKSQCHKRYVKALQKWALQQQKAAKFISKTKVIPEVCLCRQMWISQMEKELYLSSHRNLTRTRPKTWWKLSVGIASPCTNMNITKLKFWSLWLSLYPKGLVLISDYLKESTLSYLTWDTNLTDVERKSCGRNAVTLDYERTRDGDSVLNEPAVGGVVSPVEECNI